MLSMSPPIDETPTFPERLSLELNDAQRSLLEYLKERMPERSDEELAMGIFSRGLAFVVLEERQKAGKVVRGQQKEGGSFPLARTLRLFPTHFNLVLDEIERIDLDELFDLHPHVGEVELVHKAIRAGIEALKHVAKKRDPSKPTRTEVEATRRSMAQTAARKGIRRKPEPFSPNHVDRQVSCTLTEEPGTDPMRRVSAARKRRMARRAMLRTICPVK